MILAYVCMFKGCWNHVLRLCSHLKITKMRLLFKMAAVLHVQFCIPLYIISTFSPVKLSLIRGCTETLLYSFVIMWIYIKDRLLVKNPLCFNYFIYCQEGMSYLKVILTKLGVKHNVQVRYSTKSEYYIHTTCR